MSSCSAAILTDVRKMLIEWASSDEEDAKFDNWISLCRAREFSLIHHSVYRCSLNCPPRLPFTLSLWKVVLKELAFDTAQLLQTEGRRLKYRSGVIFALYTLYYTQPEPLDSIKERAKRHLDDGIPPICPNSIKRFWRVPIRITPHVAALILDLRQELFRKQQWDTMIVLRKLFSDDFAIEYTASDINCDEFELFPEQNHDSRHLLDLQSLRQLAIHLVNDLKETPRANEIRQQLSPWTCPVNEQDSVRPPQVVQAPVVPVSTASDNTQVPKTPGFSKTKAPELPTYNDALMDLEALVDDDVS